MFSANSESSKPVTITTGITTHIIEGTGGDRGSLVC